jgi:histidyl-tRNA synthetase
MVKAAIPKGMRDFSSAEVLKREYIFNTIKQIYSKYGFLPIETPAMENIETLTEKYGEEGDKLLFRVLNSGNFLEKVPDEVLQEKSITKLKSQIAEKGLRYDLTVPLARYVSMYRNEIIFPFKRFQIQPVWRADKPQKGRYREFYQCDADVIGSDSLIYDAECIAMFDEVFHLLGIPKMTVKVNNRKILYGITEAFGIPDKFIDLTVAIDKLDKIGPEGVAKELQQRGIQQDNLMQIQELLQFDGDNNEKLNHFREKLSTSETAEKGLDELQLVLDLVDQMHLLSVDVQFDISLARGLNYYTSTIFETVTGAVKIGSLASGGRYDDLTSAFELPDMPGVGISFGADRIYDVLDELGLFPVQEENRTDVMLVNFGGEDEKFSFKVLQLLRHEGISAEMYPSPAKMAKQFKYADKKGFRFVISIGSSERESGVFSIKNLETGEQQGFQMTPLVEFLKGLR